MSYYNSTTHGKIPLSVTGKYLLQRLRFTIVHAIGTGDYDADRQAIAHARGELARYISRLENPISYFGEPPMCTKTPSPAFAAFAATDVASVPADALSAYRLLADKTIAAVKSHGRDAVLTLLRTHGAARVSQLTVASAANYSRDLDKLMQQPTPAEIKARELEGVILTARKTYKPGGAMFNASDYARHLFEAGRAYEAGQRHGETRGVDMGVRSNY